MHQIHIITYSLEKAIAYFAQEFQGGQRQATISIAEMVEQLHINSENNRTVETQANLNQYLELAKAFSTGLTR